MTIVSFILEELYVLFCVTYFNISGDKLFTRL